MRRMFSVLIAAVVVAGSSTVGAQTDPKLTSDVLPELDPNEVSLSRPPDAIASAEFIGRAAWRVKLFNGATNELGRASFTARTVVTDASHAVIAVVSPIDGSVGTSSVIRVDGVDPACTVNAADPSLLECNFGGSIPARQGAEFIIVAKTPVSGSFLRLAWSFGGDEGSGGGNGCCTKFDQTVDTSLIDAKALNASVKTHVQSFMVSNVLTKAFTGVTPLPTAADPWKTTADTGGAYTVNGLPRTYTQLVIDEQVNPISLGSCSALQNNQCWVSQVSIPNTMWTVDNPLKITLDRHSSSIKNGSKLSNYVIQYKADSATSYTSLQQCTATNPNGPSSGTPCLDGPCVEIPLATSPPTYVWRCNVKAIENGGYKVQ
jgi:hypothetical protein